MVCQPHQNVGELSSTSSLLEWHRTCNDPFKEVWELIASWVLAHPERTGGAILRELQRLFPDRYQPSHLRTLQRGLRKIRARLRATVVVQWQQDVIQAERSDLASPQPSEQEASKTDVLGGAIALPPTHASYQPHPPDAFPPQCAIEEEIMPSHAVQEDFTDGVCFVSLAPLQDAGLVLSTIVRALHLQGMETQPPLAYLKASLRERHLLLVLDNFEHVIAAAMASLVGTSKPHPPLLLPFERTFAERADYERMVSIVRTRLGKKPFAKAWAEGCMLMAEQAVAVQEQPLVSDQPHASQKTQPHQGRVPPPPPGLTQREGEVLRLVAQGLSNAQIAEALVISPRTVDAHLRSIYSKLNIASRHAAIHYAHEHHLV